MDKSIYSLIKEEYIKELDIKAYHLEHIKSGAEVLCLKCKDDNKAFGAAFKTPPSDNTGVPHILEHGVLGGSRKYKTKEPFMNLAQSSMATFLNAATYPDKTVYPIASRNAEDFKNLADVYLDAVFYPDINNEKIFRQEAWRHDIAKKEDPIRYKGVVYSEMLGAMSSPIGQLFNEINKHLFKDTPYAYESGGLPENIPDLSFAEYKAFHKKYYHPSNARLYLYGDLDFAAFLDYLDKDYLSKFDKTDVNPQIPLQEPFAEPKSVKTKYSIGVNEDPQDKSYAALSLVLNTYKDYKDNMILNVLVDSLFNSQAGPIKTAIEEAHLAQDHFTFADLNKQNSLSVILINTNEEKAKQLKPLLEKTLKELVSEGIDRDLLLASLNRIEVSLRELNHSKNAGVAYLSKSLNSWLYGGDPIAALKYEDLINSLRNELDSSIWEDFIQEKLLDNPHKLEIIAEPVPGLAAKQQVETAKKLAEYKASLSNEELDALIAKNQELYKWQETPDSPELKASIPSLSLKDLDTKLPKLPNEVSKEGKATLLKHALATNGINYLLYSFSFKHIEQDDLYLVSILNTLLGKLATKNFSHQELSKELALVSSGLGFRTRVATKLETNEPILRFEVSTKSLEADNSRLIDLITEVLKNTEFDNYERIKDILDAELVNYQEAIAGRGNTYGLTRVYSKFDLQSLLADKLAGIDYYFKLKDLLSNFEERKADLSQRLEDLSRKLFRTNNLIISLTASKEDMQVFSDTALEILDSLEDKAYEPAEYKLEDRPEREAICTTSNVNYVCQAYDYKELSHLDYEGSMVVMANMLSSDFMHNMIRAKGGAYGNAINVNRRGGIACTSYRDPNIKYSLDTYKILGDWLINNDFSKKDIEEYIIGSMNSFNPVLTPRRAGRMAYTRYLTGLTQAKVEQNLAEALATDETDLANYGQVLNEAMAKDTYVVIGNAEQIKEQKDLFTKIIEL